MSRDEAAAAAQAEALADEVLRILEGAGVSPSEREELAESLRVWLPRFVQRSDSQGIDPARVEAALLHVVTLYARQYRASISPN